MLSTLRKRINQLHPLKAVSSADRQVLAICMAASFVCWFILKLTGTYTTQRVFQINYRVPESKVLLSELPAEAIVTIKGRGWKLLQYGWSSHPSEIEYDLSYIYQEGQVSASDLLGLANTKLASTSLSVDQIEFPASLISLAEKSSKRVPVRADLELAYPPGYVELHDPKLSPDSVTVYGSEAQLEAINDWPTQSLSRDLSSDGLQIRLALAKHEQGIELSPDSVDLSLELEAYADRTFYVPVSVHQSSQVDSFRIFPDRVQLKVALRQSVYDAITADSFQVVADVRNMPSSSTRNVVTLQLEQQPQGVVNVIFEQRTANYFVYD